MKRKIFITALVSWCLLPFWGYAQESDDQSIILTIKKIVMSSPNRIAEIYLIDENENKIVFLFANASEWFVNATLESIYSPEDVRVSVGVDDNFLLYDKTKLVFEFKVGETIYPIGVWNDSKLVVQKVSDEKYILLPEESVKFSPPPIKEQKN